MSDFSIRNSDFRSDIRSYLDQERSSIQVSPRTSRPKLNLGIDHAQVKAKVSRAMVSQGHEVASGTNRKRGTTPIEAVTFSDMSRLLQGVKAMEEGILAADDEFNSMVENTGDQWMPKVKPTRLEIDIPEGLQNVDNPRFADFMSKAGNISTVLDTANLMRNVDHVVEHARKNGLTDEDLGQMIDLDGAPDVVQFAFLERQVELASDPSVIKQKEFDSERYSRGAGVYIGDPFITQYADEEKAEVDKLFNSGFIDPNLRNDIKEHSDLTARSFKKVNEGFGQLSMPDRVKEIKRQRSDGTMKIQEGRTIDLVEGRKQFGNLSKVVHDFESTRANMRAALSDEDYQEWDTTNTALTKQIVNDSAQRFLRLKRMKTENDPGAMEKSIKSGATAVAINEHTEFLARERARAEILKSARDAPAANPPASEAK